MLKNYVFDIDGTICTLTDGDYTKARPLQSRVNKINHLYDSGNYIIFHTARGMGRYNNDQSKAIDEFYELTKGQLSLWGVKYHRLFLGKPSGDIYIDDKAKLDKDFFNDYNR